MLLAGGAARRFGGLPKGLARVEGVRIADRVLRAMEPVTWRQVVVANDPRAPGWFPSHTVVPDQRAGLGPLAGIVTAIRAGAGAPVLVVAWDMPWVTAPLLAALARLGADALASAIPVHGHDRIMEPLCAYYLPAAADTAEVLLAAGERRAHALHEALVARGLAVAVGDRELAGCGEPARLFASIDTADQLAALGGEPPHGI